MKKIGLHRTPFSPEQIEELRRIAGEHGYELAHLQTKQLTSGSPTADCEALMGFFPKKTLQASAALRWLHTPSAGVDAYLSDELYVNGDGTVLTNSSGAYGIPISEYMICGLLMIKRRMPMYLDNQRRREWKQYPGIQTLFGSHVAVVGVGDLGSSFACRCHLMGARVTGVRRSAGRDMPEGFDRMFTVDRLGEAIADADVVALCLPATEGTQKLFDGAMLGRMKRGAILINVGRGSAVDEKALADALTSGHLGGALLDVADPEPMARDNPLWDCPGTVITPHISGLDRDKLAANIVYDIYRDNLTRYLTGQPLKNVVDRKRGY